MGDTILTHHQQQFLDFFSKTESLYERFYLTGGTCLAEYYLHHRKSEDLDFFTEEEFVINDITPYIKRAQEQLVYHDLEYHHSFNRHMFFLHFEGDISSLKIEFTYYPFALLKEPGLVYDTVRIDSMRDIAVNKVFTISQQARGRDYYDLYMIMQQTRWDINELVKDARMKFDYRIDPVEFGSHLMQVQQTLDDPIITSSVSHKTIINYFLTLAKTFKGIIF